MTTETAVRPGTIFKYKDDGWFWVFGVTINDSEAITFPTNGAGSALPHRGRIPKNLVLAPRGSQDSMTNEVKLAIAAILRVIK